MNIRAIAILLFTVATIAATETTYECVDLTVSCAMQSQLCNINEYDSLMNYYCKKTCNRNCRPFTTTTTAKPCADITPDCLNKPHICTMPEYTALAIKFCAKTCGRCK